MNEDPLTVDVIEWIRSNAIRLKTVEPNDDFSDLLKLKEVLSGVDAIGLGEATHGTREFFQFKHRLLRFLSTELGFNTLAFETPFPGDINTSIHDRKVNLLDAFREQTFVVWQTEEILEMIAWMRARNGEKPEARIDFVGIDCQLNKSLIYKSIDALSNLGCAQANVDRLRKTYDDFLEHAKLKPQASTRLVLLGSSLIQLISFMRASAETSGLSDSISDYLSVLSQAVQLYMVQSEHRTSRNLRDKFMADNVSHLIGKGQKVAVWAHNGHVSCLKTYNREDMGHHLRTSFGNRYYAVAFAFFKGAFRSNFKSRTQSSEYCVAMPPSENLEHLFVRTGIPMFFLDLRSARKDLNIERWWSLSHKIQGTGALFNSKTGSLGSYSFSNQEYDGVVFIEQTDTSRTLRDISSGASI